MNRRSTTPVAVRWTIGDVSDRGFEALRLSIWGAWRLFGEGASYAVTVNSLPVDRARRRTDELPARVAWLRVTADDLPACVRGRLDDGMAEGVGWKLAPARLFPDRYEISLDNDCILWHLPAALQRWLAGAANGRCVLAEDVRACFGQFADLCAPDPRNAGIRGLPPGFDLEAALRAVLHQREAATGRPVRMTSELDEQGLQTAALSTAGPPLAVALEDVTVCSPFWPHRPELGRCGAHFCGLNSRHIAWDYFGRPADDWMTDHWRRHRGALYRRVGAPAPAACNGIPLPATAEPGVHSETCDERC